MENHQSDDEIRHLQKFKHKGECCQGSLAKPTSPWTSGIYNLGGLYLFLLATGCGTSINFEACGVIRTLFKTHCVNNE